MLEHGIVDAYVLEDDEALILKALNEFTDQAAGRYTFFGGVLLCSLKSFLNFPKKTTEKP